ncbi:hypothetical protein FB566_3434 [Stackebrandtia endophytica]|uniref:Uncharacterized protein n=1 Tax=Stackebrandtia endophytica TaxID=1496996 RepID=A0A543AZ73_9ACTN|nr:hypothetical protein [Stackebrandtia endophytica]TQL77864.1 hypothetical protein FB566_3434 [Stackebrandtia endophytica]
MRLFRIVAVGTAMLCWATAALIGATASDDTTAASASRLTATVELRRIPGDDRVLAIAVENHGDHPITVIGAELATDSFTPTGLLPVEVTVPVGAIRDVFIAYGRGICGDELSPTAAPATARLLLTDRQRVDLALPHPDGTLDRLLATDCAAAYLDRTVSIAFRDWDTDSDGRLRANLELTRVGGAEPFRLDRLSGNPHFDLTVVATAEPVAILDGRDDRMTVPVVVDVDCDAHNLAEAKQPFRFPLWLTVGDRVAIPTTIPVTTSDIAHLETLRTRRCG